MTIDRWQRAGDTWGEYLDRFCAEAPIDAVTEPLSIQEWGRTARRDAHEVRRTSGALLAYEAWAETMRRLTPTLVQMGEAFRRFGETVRSVGRTIETAGTAAGARVVVKRLRHGREHRRIVWPRPAQPTPWKGRGR